MGWKLLLRRSTLIEAQHCANLLEAAGIRAQVRNRFLAGAIGEIPPTEAWPQVWVPESQDSEAALLRLHELSSEMDRSAPDWSCPVCGERIEPQFGACWNCGHPRPAGD